MLLAVGPVGQYEMLFVDGTASCTSVVVVELLHLHRFL